MADSDTDKKKSFQEKSLESQKSIAFDNDCKQKDLNAFITKHKYLQGFRNTNKDVSLSICLSHTYLQGFRNTNKDVSLSVYFTRIYKDLGTNRDVSLSVCLSI